MLEPRAPDCSICSQETNWEDNRWECEHCRASWPDDSSAYEDPGDWMSTLYEDERVPRCPAIIRPYADYPNFHEPSRFTEYRCYLDAGHDEDDAPTEHRHPDYIGSWKGTMEPDERGHPAPHFTEEFPLPPREIATVARPRRVVITQQTVNDAL